MAWKLLNLLFISSALQSVPPAVNSEFLQFSQKPCYSDHEKAVGYTLNIIIGTTTTILVYVLFAPPYPYLLLHFILVL